MPPAQMLAYHRGVGDNPHWATRNAQQNLLRVGAGSAVALTIIIKKPMIQGWP